MASESKQAPFAPRFSTPLLCALVLLLCIAAGCATPIGVNYVDRRVAYHSLTANILSAERPSAFSGRELINFNLYQRFEDEPETALAALHAGLAPKGDEDRLFALAELSFAHAENSGERSYYLAAAVYAYSLLLPGEHGTPPRPVDPRFRWAADIYNQSLTAALIALHGVPAVEEWARGLVANFARPPAGGDREQIQGVAAGLCDVALANTYYLGGMLRGEDGAQRDAASKVAVPDATAPTCARCIRS